MKILGIDHGNVRIGIAVSDDTGNFARPLSIFMHVSRQQDADEIRRVCEQQGCELIVVGVPYDSDGGEGPRARSVLRFVKELTLVVSVPVTTWDESFSTHDVTQTSLQLGKSRSSRMKALDDRVAAVILQSYLDHKAQITGGEGD